MSYPLLGGTGLVLPASVEVIPLPADPTLCGAEFFLQALHADPAAPLGYVLTPGMQATLGS